ncbi:MAG: flagellar hook-associated protein FlgK [Rhodobacteraceae bacterium PARR1]|nr:MAG: flagellar hook-associated protein FlgK [Rhodobacteraceae bacterium PARR1]
MTLSSAFSAALSGLSASTRRADVVASNIANAQTPGYVRRQVDLAPAGPEAGRSGVQVRGIVRLQDAALLADRRLAQAASADAEVAAGFLKTAEGAFGTPDQPGSLGARLARLDAALTTASAQPASDARLAEVQGALSSLTLGLRQATATVQSARQAADTRIAAEVGRLNTSLAQVDALNDRIATDRAAGNDITPLLDQRQMLVDGIAAIAPLREVARDQGRIALYTIGGAVLLEDNPARLDFDQTPMIGAEDADLGGLRLNDRPVTMGAGGVLDGGSLGALFRLRDDLAPQAQARLDHVAADLAGRLAATDSHAGMGWLTDRGNALDPTGRSGLAGRLAVNVRLDPAQGGALWRLRDGLSAAQPGALGNGGRLTAQASALAAGQGVPSMSGLMADLLGQTAQARLEGEQQSSFATARTTALVQVEQEKGVDTDAELQDLMQVEQAYGANAKVIQTLDDLMKLLLGM